MDIQIHRELSNQQYAEIESLEKLIFDKTYRPGHFKREAPNKPDLIALLGYQEQNLVAYKVGYSVKKDTFYSWVGGVHPGFRRKGWAHRLMDEQHKLLAKQGFRSVSTKTRSNYRGMLILNLLSGFDITGVSIKDRVPGLIIQMKKNLI